MPIPAPWVSAWIGAVARPAWRRAAAVWGALGLVGAFVLGPQALMPAEVVALLRAEVGVSVVLGAIWIALLVPVTRLLVRPPGGAYLRSLPSPRGAALLPLAALALFQLPVLALLLAGGARAAAVLVWLSSIAASWLAATIHLPARPPRAVEWETPGRGLCRMLAARLLADDTIARALGFALLAGGGSGLLVRNNGLAGGRAAAIGLGAIAILAMPALAATTTAIGLAHRRLEPLCAWSGVPRATWLAAGAAVSAAAAAGFTMIAAGACAGIARLGAADGARVIGLGAVVGAAMGVAGARAAIWATRGDRVPGRVMAGCLAVGVATAATLLGLGEPGAALVAAVAIASVARVQLRGEEP